MTEATEKPRPTKFERRLKNGKLTAALGENPIVGAAWFWRLFDNDGFMYTVSVPVGDLSKTDPDKIAAEFLKWTGLSDPPEMSFGEVRRAARKILREMEMAKVL